LPTDRRLIHTHQVPVRGPLRKQFLQLRNEDRVRKRVEKIIDEKMGKIMWFKNANIVSGVLN
jgi:hypothetical protein